jgi:hypothetical protein
MPIMRQAISIGLPIVLTGGDGMEIITTYIVESNIPKNFFGYW